VGPSQTACPWLIMPTHLIFALLFSSSSPARVPSNASLDSNAMMFNSEGSQVYDMAQEMLRESENHIARFRSMQHDMGR